MAMEKIRKVRNINTSIHINISMGTLTNTRLVDIPMVTSTGLSKEMCKLAEVLKLRHSRSRDNSKTQEGIFPSLIKLSHSAPTSINTITITETKIFMTSIPAAKTKRISINLWSWQFPNHPPLPRTPAGMFTPIRANLLQIQFLAI